MELRKKFYAYEYIDGYWEFKCQGCGCRLEALVSGKWHRYFHGPGLDQIYHLVRDLRVASMGHSQACLCK